MPAYLMFFREGPMRNAAEYDEYARKAGQGTGGPQPKVLSLYGPVQALEGQAPEGVVMLEFSTADDAKAWYESPGYQAALPHRKRAADWRVMIVESA